MPRNSPSNEIALNSRETEYCVARPPRWMFLLMFDGVAAPKRELLRSLKLKLCALDISCSECCDSPNVLVLLKSKV